MQDSFAHCEALVREADKDRFLATLFASAKHRRALFALYAFNVEVARVREVAREPMPGEIRLQWWRDVFADSGRGEVRAHPVASALLDTVVRYRLPPQVLVELIDARSFDLYDDPMPDLATLDAYAAKTSAALMRLAALILNDGNDPNIASLTDHAGIAYAIAGLLSAVALHASRRQLYLPLDVLHRYGARAEDVFAGQATPALHAALRELRDHARHHLEAARSLVGAIPTQVAPALLPVALVRPALARMDRRGYDPFRPAPLPQWRKQWTLWRTARRGLAQAL